jgi:hypothetical protein
MTVSPLHLRVLVALLKVVILLCLAAPAAGGPHYQYAAHSQGNIQITLNNRGWYGIGPEGGIVDPFTGDLVYGLIYPRNSYITYIRGDIAVGAIVGNDTLVTSWQEFSPAEPPFGAFEAKSIDPGSGAFATDAYSELDLTCVYYDTLTDPAYVPMDYYDQRYHIPLGLRVTQRSMAWSAPNIDDFILINYHLANIGGKSLKDVFVRINGVARSQYIPDPPTMSGDHCGFLHIRPAPDECGYVDSVNVAYGISVDGDGAWDPNSPGNLIWDERSARAAVGIRVVGLPADAHVFNYNWDTGPGGWPGSMYGWGPRKRGSIDDPFRRIGANIGFPEGDANNYYVMAHPEFDYDLMFSYLDHTSEGWLPPLGGLEGWRLALNGWAPNFSLSFGPIDMPPKTTAEFTIAIVAGDSVHVDPNARKDLADPEDPWPFYNSLDFSRLAENAVWADWIYDNPGFDTDGDGYAGEYRVCGGDTTWYKGDGVPDFRADVAPPSPIVKVVPSTGKLVIRWNGYISESFIDPVTRLKDFEGYRVYVGLDSRRSTLSLLCSWDHENYIRYILIEAENNVYKWTRPGLPLSPDSLQALYGADFAPLSYTRVHPFNHNDTLYYFTKLDHNQSDLSNLTLIHKVYPEAPDPGDDSTLWTEDDMTMEHGRPLPKFYEYEYIYDNILPTVSYFVGVTAFDFGAFGGRIPPKESKVENNLIEAYAQTSSDTVEAYNLDVYVYPNPWRVDAEYRARGFENRSRTEIPNRSRRIHFGNLPRVCKISIYSPDGDLIRVIDHNYPEGGPEAMHDTWDFITRNTQLVVSGLYFYVVESEHRTQIGKFVIIM